MRRDRTGVPCALGRGTHYGSHQRCAGFDSPDRSRLPKFTSASPRPCTDTSPSCATRPYGQTGPGAGPPHNRLVEVSSKESPRIAHLGQKDRKIQRANGISKQAALFSDWFGGWPPQGNCPVGQRVRGGAACPCVLRGLARPAPANVLVVGSGPASRQTFEPVRRKCQPSSGDAAGERGYPGH